MIHVSIAQQWITKGSNQVWLYTITRISWQKIADAKWIMNKDFQDLTAVVEVELKAIKGWAVNQRINQKSAVKVVQRTV